MFRKIFIEKDLVDSPYAKKIIEKFPKVENVTIDSYEDHWGRKRKPYLQKRDNLNLYIAHKKGQLLKEAPDAYGLVGEPHYYYVHAYNCIYECDYCYLQGYFYTPDMVLFVNHDEIIEQITNKIENHLQKENSKGIWFHAGEFSDSLALSHITQELSSYHEVFKKYPQAYLELRTKSVNIKEIEKLAPLPNVITSFSLSPQDKVKQHDLKTPPLSARLRAIGKLHQLGHPIGIHFDPIIHSENILEQYDELTTQLRDVIPLEEIEYISVGVVRFTKDVYHQVKKNYPQTEYFHSELIHSRDGKIKYPRPMRMWLLNRVRDLCIQKGANAKNVYLCMEDVD
jgi:spore photoproduct lyase